MYFVTAPVPAPSSRIRPEKSCFLSKALAKSGELGKIAPVLSGCFIKRLIKTFADMFEHVSRNDAVDKVTEICKKIFGGIMDTQMVRLFRFLVVDVDHALRKAFHRSVISLAKQHASLLNARGIQLECYIADGDASALSTIEHEESSCDPSRLYWFVLSGKSRLEPKADGDGLDFLMKLKQRFSPDHCKTALMSAEVLPESKIEELRRLDISFYQKPFGHAELESILLSFIG